MKNLVFALLSLIFLSSFRQLNAQTDSILAPAPRLFQIESYIDSLAKVGMDKYQIPGAIVTVITDTTHIFNKGYGFADLENEIFVDSDRTLFRIASVTKTFTATAAMQLVEQGKLDMKADLRNYLPDDDFDFLDGAPITMHHLLTHTAGFDVTDTRDAALTPDQVVPLEQLARRQMPDQVHPPGTIYSYSNFGFALAGFIIQEISGIPYEEYIIQNILNPLGMINTGIYQPLPERLKTNLAQGYVWKDQQIPLTRDYTNTLPGGGIISTAKDMSRYMMMHLQGGYIDRTVILPLEYHKILTSQQFGSRSTNYGICYAFNENMWTGRRTLEHSGGQLGFVSLLILIPETGTGIFIAQNNRKDAGGFRYDMVRAILDTLIGRKDRVIDTPTPPADFDAIAANYVGRYRQMNYPHNTFEKISLLFGFYANEHQINHDTTGRLIIFGDPFIQKEKNLFQMDSPRSTYKVEFLTDENGVAYQLNAGVSSFQKIPWYKHNRLKQILTMLATLFLLIQFMARPISNIYRRIKNKPSVAKHTWFSNWQYWTATFFVLGFIGLITIFLIYQDQVSDYYIPIPLLIVLSINTIATLSSLVAPFALWNNWKSEVISRNAKIFNTLIILGIITTPVMLINYHMVGFQYY